MVQGPGFFHHQYRIASYAASFCAAEKSQTAASAKGPCQRRKRLGYRSLLCACASNWCGSKTVGVGSIPCPFCKAQNKLFSTPAYVAYVSYVGMGGALIFGVQASWTSPFQTASRLHQITKT